MIEILQKYFQIYDRNMAEIFSDLGQKYFQKYGRNIFRNLTEIWEIFSEILRKRQGLNKTHNSKEPSHSQIILQPQGHNFLATNQQIL